MKTDSIGSTIIFGRAAGNQGIHTPQIQVRYLSLMVRSLVLVLVSVVVLAGGALANPPSNVNLAYDQNSGDLIVTIGHQVDDPATHFIKEVTITQDNRVIADKFYTNQPDRTSFTYRYNLPQLRGSRGEIQATAQCSLFGSRSGTIVLGANPDAGTASSASPITPAPTKAPLGIVATVLAIVFIARQVFG